jgi:hypothetical protein
MADPLKPGAVWNGTDPRTGKKYTWDGGYYYDEPPPEPPPTTTMSTVKISRAFAKLGGDSLSDFAVGIYNGMNSNAAFATPPVTMPALQTAQLLLHNSIAPAKTNGHAAVLAKQAAKDDLILKLRALAKYIEDLPNITEAIAATSNFVLITPSTHIPTTPDVPIIEKIYNVATTKLGVKIKMTGTFRIIEYRAAAPGKAPQIVATSTNARDAVLPDLQPGTVYAVDCRALAGNQVASEWSDPVSHMST